MPPGGNGIPPSGTTTQEPPDQAALSASAVRDVLLAVTEQPLVTGCPRQTASAPPTRHSLPRSPAVEDSSSRTVSNGGACGRSFIEDPGPRENVAKAGGGATIDARIAESGDNSSVEIDGTGGDAVGSVPRRVKRGRSFLSREVTLPPDERPSSDEDCEGLSRPSSSSSLEEEAVKIEEEYYDCRPSGLGSSSARDGGAASDTAEALHPDNRRGAIGRAVINRGTAPLGTGRQGVHTVSAR